MFFIHCFNLPFFWFFTKVSQIFNRKLFGGFWFGLWILKYYLIISTMFSSLINFTKNNIILLWYYYPFFALSEQYCSTLLPTRCCEHLFYCLKYFKNLLETFLFRFFTASLVLCVFRSLSLMISLDACKYGWMTGSLSFSVDFLHWSSSLDFLTKCTSKADLQPSFSLFSLLRHFAYFCKFFDQLTAASSCVSRSYVIFLLKDLCDCSTFPCDWGWYGLLFVISIFLFFAKHFDSTLKFFSSITLKSPRISVLFKNFLEFGFYSPWKFWWKWD